MHKTPIELLRVWLHRQLPASGWEWLDAQLGKLAGDPSNRLLHVTLGMIPRKLGKDDLSLNPDDLNAAEQVRSGWQPQFWSVDNAARVLAVCSPRAGDVPFADRFGELCRYADVAELIALYRGLPLYPLPEQLKDQAAEGVRTNMRAVFEAVAHHNPFPREQFDQNRWNQMVLKALFIGSRLWPIQGLDERANADLARILSDYAHERWAAGRPVALELWRCVGPFAEDNILNDLERVLNSDSDDERRAAVLALSMSPAAAAGQLLAAAPELVAEVRAGTLNWNTFAQTL
jgi:hypothetical protein